MAQEEGSKSISLYLSRLRPDTQETVGGILRRWMLWIDVDGGKFSGFTLDQIVEYQRGKGGYEVLDLIQGYMATLTTQRAGYKRRVYSAIINLFAHNRVPLPPDPGYKVKSDAKPVQGELTADHVKQIALGSNVMYRAAVLCMFSAGMGVGELIKWSNAGMPELRRQIEEKARPIKVTLPGRKMNLGLKPYYTFISSDAEKALKDWLKIRPEPRRGDAIFLSRYRTPLSKGTMQHYWLAKLKRVGLVQHQVIDSGHRRGTIRYGMNVHEARDAFRSRWRPSGVDVEVGEFFMGHDLDLYHYDKSPWSEPDHFRACYLSAEPWLNIMSGDPSRVPVLEVAELRAKLESAEREQSGKVAELEERVDKLTAALEAIYEREKPKS